ncbi:MAG: hypothetical protein H8E74_01785 [Gammaproteobacteria bacterium]|nr:hypothetical protein [Gammaproteobacteria bacterium]
MNKQELAEFMAEKVLDKNAYEFRYDINNVIKFIYSPEGFFAVWDVVDVKFDYQLQIIISRMAEGTASCRIMDLPPNKILANIIGKDRYEAFYNAVYEVMKDE